MTLVHYFLAAVVAAMGAAVPTEKTSGNHTVDFIDTDINRGKLYPLTCNNENLNTYHMIMCRDQIANRGGNCQVGPRTAHLCEYGGTKVSARAFDNGVAVSSCGDVAGGLNDIINVCGGRGGSNAANGNGNLIVHANGFWLAGKR